MVVELEVGLVDASVDAVVASNLVDSMIRKAFSTSKWYPGVRV